MPVQVERLDALTRLFEYPSEEYARQVEQCAEAMAGTNAQASQWLRKFLAEAGGRRLNELEELYIQTFDMNPGGCLDIGWHLFGEDYARGEFLVKMNQEIRRYGLGESCELPDHITRVMPVFARMSEEDASRLLSDFLAPALGKIALAVEEANPYTALLSALAAALGADLTELRAAAARAKAETAAAGKRESTLTVIQESAGCPMEE